MKGPALIQYSFGSIVNHKRPREDDEDFSTNFDWNRQSSFNSSNSSEDNFSSPEEVRHVKKFKKDDFSKLQSVYEGSLRGKARRGRCNRCPTCLRPDCGQCTNCLDKPKFGGPGRKKQSCSERKCPIMRGMPVAILSGFEEEEAEFVPLSNFDLIKSIINEDILGYLDNLEVVSEDEEESIARNIKKEPVRETFKTETERKRPVALEDSLSGIVSEAPTRRSYTAINRKIKDEPVRESKVSLVDDDIFLGFAITEEELEVTSLDIVSRIIEEDILGSINFQTGSESKADIFSMFKSKVQTALVGVKPDPDNDDNVSRINNDFYINNPRIDPKLKAVLDTFPRFKTIPDPLPKDVRRTFKRFKQLRGTRNYSSSRKFERDEPQLEERSFEEEMEIVLGSFNKKPGFGDNLKRLLPPAFKDTSDGVAAFLLFVAERQNMWQRKYEGRDVLTNNDILASKWFTNMYRELDRGTQYFRKIILETTLKHHRISADIDENIIEEVLFKSIIYRLINEVKTFMAFGGIPSKQELRRFIEFAKERHENSSEKVFTAAHQNNGMRRFLDSCEVIKRDIGKLAIKIASYAEKRSLNRINEVLLSIKGVGKFFAWQILCDLLEARILGVNCDNQWTSLGPGAKNGLRRLFTEDKLPTSRRELRHTRLVRDLCAASGSKSGFEALGINFRAFLGKPLSLKNVEHALCEYDKYYRSALSIQIKEREYSEMKSNKNIDKVTECSICDEVGDVQRRVMCALCRRYYHHGCDQEYQDKFLDNVWLCSDCHEVEMAWREDDLDHEEYDEDDERVATKFVSGASKKYQRVNRKKKASHRNSRRVSKRPVWEISSDSETDDEDVEEDNDYDQYVMQYNVDKDPFESMDDAEEEPDYASADDDDEVVLVSDGKEFKFSFQ